MNSVNVIYHIYGGNALYESRVTLVHVGSSPDPSVMFAFFVRFVINN